ncbi:MULTISPECIES: lipopolysaccharide transport periplasmic protein LptA [unclassified Psychrobacter]|uniref:lipopolysaccharide transport periplasmic protein LptA n=1 Tax=unclassified Psychrobacter TaxID=196806 RepID=UPI0025B33E6E|nr:MULTISPECIES: lipopolysaccharide transport periplasmic protein LptA [unclassified Psychrobacter]MDN3453757.1 lipopolysaccharide transport periplasmic protein LptA [Psychrobacter sp. APC 3350]MDN3503082.1 lipopolysaccharide transport periplasmic protein LptA [Psychrobacter sp. 5A.1]
MKLKFLPTLRPLSTCFSQVSLGLHKLRALPMVMLLALPLYSHALPSDSNQQIKLLADKATYSERTGVTSYAGNVIITQGTFKMTADNITVNLSQQRSINSAVATGRPATMQQVVTPEKGIAKGQANKIDYNAVSGIITLTGNAKLVQNGASFAGNVIRYSLKAGDVEATAGGNQRVELVFPPNNGTNQSGVR